jgi:hypothetical protein
MMYLFFFLLVLVLGNLILIIGLLGLFELTKQCPNLIFVISLPGLNGDDLNI